MDLHSVFEFLENKRGRPVPFLYKLAHDPDSIKEEDLIIEKDLELNGTNIKKLPDDLTVTGSFIIYRDTGLKKLPKGLFVEEILEITGVNLTEIPKDLVVGRSLRLAHLNHLKKFPKGLLLPPKVSLIDLPLMRTLEGDWRRVRDLHISRMNIEKFPLNNIENLRDLHLSYVTAEGLPEGLHLHDLQLAHCLDKIGNIPKNLTVTGTLKIVQPPQETRDLDNFIKELRARIEAEGGNVHRIGVSAGVGRFRIG